MYVQSAEFSLKMVCSFVKTAGRRGTFCSKEEHERWCKSWHYTVSAICYSDYWIVFVRIVVLYAGGTSRPDDYDFTREGRREIS